jgi:hypothetical protein
VLNSAKYESSRKVETILSYLKTASNTDICVECIKHESASLA